MPISVSDLRPRPLNLTTLRTFLLVILLLPQLGLLAQLDLMSYNIRYDNPNDGEDRWELRREAVAGLIDYYHPHFVGLQEALHHQVIFLEENTSGYARIGVGRDDGAMKGEYTAVLYDTSAYRLVKQETFWLSPTPDRPSVGWDAALERICTYGRFERREDGTEIHVFNAHFDHRGERARTESARLIAARIRELGLLDEKVVVMGDLNSTPETDALAALTEVLEDAGASVRQCLYGPIGTFSGFNLAASLDRRIDYVLTRNLQVKRYRHVDDRRADGRWVSDHLPVLVECTLPAAG